MLVFHKDCGGRILTDVSEFIKISAQFSVGSEKLKISGFRISSGMQKGKLVNPTFICNDCEKIVELKDIFVSCDACGDFLDLDSAFTSKETNNVFCERHFKNYGGRSKPIPLSKIFNEVEL